MYNTATGQGLQWRVPDAPFIMETFCMGDHGIVSGYHPGTTLRTHGDWGCTGRCCTRSPQHSPLGAACPTGDPRPLVHQVLDAFWRCRH